jgi:hypothetical protein
MQGSLATAEFLVYVCSGLMAACIVYVKITCLFLGRDVSVGVHHEPNLHLDLVALPNERMFVNLETPPRVITLDERPFPTLEDTERPERGLNGHLRGHRFSRYMTCCHSGLVASNRYKLVSRRQSAILSPCD